MTTAVLAVVGREFKRFARQRGRLLGSLARPLLWLVVIGAGFDQHEFLGLGSLSYQQFLLVGIFGMVVLFSTLLTALATVHDREFGAARMLLIAPLPRWATVAAKVASATLLGLAQAVLLLPVIWILGLRPEPLGVLALLAAVLLTAFALSSVGMLLSARLRSIENFGVVINVVMFPMFFLSGALYPVSALPGFLEVVARINPLTYGIDLMRHALLSGLGTDFAFDFTVGRDLWVLTGFAVLAFALAAGLFGQEERLSRILMSEPPKEPAAGTATAR